MRGKSLLDKEFEIIELDNKGNGVGEIDGKRIHLPYTAPGDVVKLNRVYKKRKKWQSTDFEIIKKSDIRIKPVCDHFGKAGGCAMQHLPYDYQLSFKQQKLTKILEQHLDSFENEGIQVLPSPQVNEYRNRMDVAITDKGIGFRQKGQWWNVVDVENCILFSKKLGEVLNQTREFMQEYNLQPYNGKTHEGFLRYVVVREGKHTNELMVNLVTNAGELPVELDQIFTTASSIYWSVNDTMSDVSEGEIQKFWGNEFLTENLNGIDYKIHPNSFFQSNSAMAAELIKLVDGMVEGDSVLDLYCGLGSFSLYFAQPEGWQADSEEDKPTRRVVASDINPFSIELARENAKLNDLNVDFYVESDKDVVDLHDAQTVVVDPPRPGLHKNLIKQLLAAAPPQIVYVSCNPNSLSDDLIKLREKYQITEIIGIDMFPHTPHVETVVNLKLK